MPYPLIYPALGVIIVVAALWAVAQVWRRPSNARLRIMLAVLLLWLLAQTFGRVAMAGGAGGLDATDARAVEHSLWLAGTFCLLLFLLSTIAPADRLRRTVVVQLVPAALAIAGLLVAAAAVPEPLRNEMGVVGAGGPTGVVPGSVFYLVENAYGLYAVLVALGWTARVLPDAGWPVRHGLLILTLGLVLMGIGITGMIMSNVIRATGVDPPPLYGLATMTAGIALLLFGLAYPSLRLRLREAAVTREHRRRYHELGPLWTRLHAAFPQDALAGAPGEPIRWYRRPAPVRRRYYRRVVECRDGLVRLSPYLRRIGGAEYDGSALPSPRDLDRALSACRRNEPVGTVASAVAATDGRTVDDDARRLVELSRRLA